MYRVLGVALLLTACSSQPMVFRQQPGFVYNVPGEQALQQCKAQNLQLVHASRSPIMEALSSRGNLESCMMGLGYVD